MHSALADQSCLLDGLVLGTPGTCSRPFADASGHHPDETGQCKAMQGNGYQFLSLPSSALIQSTKSYQAAKVSN